MLQVKQIVNDIFSSNTYVVYDEGYKYCWLVDIGDFDKVADVIPPGVEVKGVFLTHSHFDHIYGANALHKAFPGCILFTSAYGRDAIFNAKKNFSYYHDSPFVYEGEDVVVLRDGDIRELYPNVYLFAYYTPGHCLSCLTYLVADWVFTGDAYIPGVKIVTKLPGGNQSAAKKSLNRILNLIEGKTVCAGHG